MSHSTIEQVFQRAESAKADSDFTYFFSLLLAGEAIAKTTILGIIAAIADDKDRNRYRLEHMLVRSDGLGDWSKVFNDVLSGPASQYLLAEARTEQSELTKLCQVGEWQYDSVAALKSALDKLQIEAEAVPSKTDMKRWFRLFVTLRNKTRAHGATPAAKSSGAAVNLADSINLIYQHFSLFRRPWAYLYRNLSGKYRVSSISDDASPFDYLKRESNHSFPNGIYLFFASPRPIPLMQSDPELRDFFFANGGFNGKRFELLSYATSDRCDGDSSCYLAPPGTLPASETEGHSELLARGNCFSNAPEPAPDYVSRPRLESDLLQLLLDDRRPIVTLVGAGGAGKTSLSLKVMQQLYTANRYEAVVWLSARDIDLQLAGPKAVRPLVFSPEDVSAAYANLVLSQERLSEKGFNARKFFEQQLQQCELGPCLFVFDNFETTQNPIEMFNWIDSFARLPNKVLITTRLRDFKGDYPLEVHGMTDEEARVLVDRTAIHLGVRHLLSPDYITNLLSHSEGHPYVIRILVGEIARAGRLTSIPHLVAGRDEILTALFERTYASLTPCAQRAFMTLAAWNSAVPRLALEAVLLRSISERQEVRRVLICCSNIRWRICTLRRPTSRNLSAFRLLLVVYGKKKLHISPVKCSSRR